MLRDGRKAGFRTVTVRGVVLGIFAVPLRRLVTIAFIISGPDCVVQLSYNVRRSS